MKLSKYRFERILIGFETNMIMVKNAGISKKLIAIPINEYMSNICKILKSKCCINNCKVYQNLVFQLKNIFMARALVVADGGPDNQVGVIDVIFRAESESETLLAIRWSGYLLLTI